MLLKVIYIFFNQLKLKVIIANVDF
jgi:hypothetical protein